MTDDARAFHPQLDEIVQLFQDAQGKEKLELLLDFAMELPELPPYLKANHHEMEQVSECQTPFFMAVEVHNGQMTFFYDVPPEAPTIRGYASVLAQGAKGLTPQQVLDFPADLATCLGLNLVLSPLRLRGMQAVLARMKRHARYLQDNGHQ